MLRFFLICFMLPLCSEQIDQSAIKISQNFDAHVWDHITSYLPGRHLFLIQRLSSKRYLSQEHLERMVSNYADCYVNAIKNRLMKNYGWWDFFMGNTSIIIAAQLTHQPMLLYSQKKIKKFLDNYLQKEIKQKYYTYEVFNAERIKVNLMHYTRDRFIKDIPTSELAGLIAIEGWNHEKDNPGYFLTYKSMKKLLPSFSRYN